MSVPENKALSAPFKTMDIKAAFLAAGKRKRKATSPTALKKQPKSLKLNNESKEEIEIITESINVIIEETKENEDFNSLPSAKNVEISLGKDTSVLDSQIENKEGNEDTKYSSQSSSEEESLKEASSELNSTLNDSVNVLQTDELSESFEHQTKNEKDLNSTGVSKADTTPCSSKKISSETQKDARPKKKRKMTVDEASARSQEREEKQKQRNLKKQELEAQKLAKQKEKERRQLEREIKQKEKEKEKLEKEEERKEKERLKQEKKDQEEKERLLKLKEKEERKKQQQRMQEIKQEEKKKKEEERLKREEENKKAEEEKLEKEQREKEKSAKAKAAFMKFFKKEDPNAPSTPQPLEKEGAFKPFQVSGNMILAHVVQPAAQQRFNKSQLDQVLESQEGKELYLQILKYGCYKDVRQRKRLRKSRSCDDVIILDKSEQEQLCFTAKLLQFSENVRPPYWGTWRKCSKTISPRNPFAQDDIFDYSVDSDEEWEEGGPGESLSGTENEQESEDEYEVDNEFFVPHGYLSAEEENEEEDEITNDPEKQKAVLKIKQQEFESERKKKTTELKPIILGCYFENGPEPPDAGLFTLLLTYSAELLSDAPIPTRFTVKKLQSEAGVDSPSGANLNSKKLKHFPAEAMPFLIKLLHGNTNSQDSIIKEFQAFWQQHSQVSVQIDNVPPETKMDGNNQEMPTENNNTDLKNISKRQLRLTIKKISTYGKSPNPALKKCWVVNAEVRSRYGLLDIPIPNEWNYVTSKDEVEASPIVKKEVSSVK